MPRNSGFQLENNFTRGLITEATGLNFPENATTEAFDCIFSEKGRATRRLGFDYEPNHTNKSVNKTDGAIVEYLWTAAGGSGDTNIVVVQVGATLYYYEAVEDGALSSNIFSFTTNLLDFEVGTSTDVKGNICQFASGEGFLFVVHPLCDPFYVTFTSSGPSITETQIDIKCRDLEGDKSDTNYSNYDTRPSSITNSHKYNLYNQGWYFSANTSTGFTTPANAGILQVYDVWDAARTDFPSNADIWWLSKSGDGNFNMSYVDQVTPGNSPAPKGHYIINEFDTNRTSLSGITASERTSNGLRPSTVSFFASRVWFAGVSAQEYNQKIYYSQLIESSKNFGKCHQQNDPTSSEIFDLLPTDGGVIVIPDVGRIIKLFPMANSLLIFATNGVWSIGGSEGIGFKATDYAIRRISAVESVSALSFVDVYGSPVWWTNDSIYTISGDQGGLGNEAVTSLSDDTIKTFILDIPPDSKLYIKGAFNSRTKIIQWLYRSENPSTNLEKYVYDRVLNLNLLSRAFYPWTISAIASGPEVQGLICTRGPTATPVDELVINIALDTVVDLSDEPVTISTFSDLESTLSFRYLTTTFVSGTSWNMTWSQNIDTDYTDWMTFNSTGADYTSFFFTGYKVHGDGVKFFENNYLTVFMQTDTNSSAFVQGVWDYANTASSGRWTNPQQVYRDGGLYDIQQTRKKIRGRGRSLHFKYYSEAGKPFNIHGWAAWETQNAGV